MDDLLKKTAGGAIGAFLLFAAARTAPGPLFLCLPFLLAAPLWTVGPSMAASFASVYLAGLLAGSFLSAAFPLLWVLPQFIVLPLLLWVPWYCGRARRGDGEDLEEAWAGKKGELEALRSEIEKVTKDNARIEAKLRQIGRLYEVIKEAGGALSVQEMIELTRDFTERMFQLKHFIIAVLSDDGRKFEIRVASGCDESFFRAADQVIGSDSLIASLIEDKKPLWVVTGDGNPRFEKLRGLSVRSLVFIPFLVQERLIGFLCSYSLREDLLDRDTYASLQVFCNQISISLQKSQLYEKVQKLSITDGLTKLHTHRYFKQRLEEELVLANRYSSPLSLLLLDIDNFKRYNDTYGHVAGDHVLTEVARLLRERTDMMHLAARYGGEEMVLIASETAKAEAVVLAERIRKAVEDHPFAAGGETTRVTVSIGVAAYPLDAMGNMELISKADKALYAAKGLGRNRVAVFGE